MQLLSSRTSEINLWPDELKILSVDDEQEVLNLIRLSLEPAGFRVLRTTKPEEGLMLALQEKPDLLLLDVMLPNIDGFELLRRIRRHPKLKLVPAIILSARADTADKVRMLQLSEGREDVIAAYLGKPFDPATGKKLAAADKPAVPAIPPTPRQAPRPQLSHAHATG